MQILQYRDKGTHLNTNERFFIYAEFSRNNHLNDEHSISPKKIFDALLKPHQPPQKKKKNPHPLTLQYPGLSLRGHANLPAIITCQSPDTKRVQRYKE